MASELNGLTMRGGGRGKAEALKPIRTSCGGFTAAVEEPLSPAARVFHEPTMNCYIIAIVGIDSLIRVEVIKEGLSQTLINHPRFSSKFVVDLNKCEKKKWVRSQVNVDEHVVVPELDVDMESADQFVDGYISNLTTTSMDMSKPLWELHILNIKTSNAEALGVFKIHHSLGDGISLISLLLACTRKTSDPNSVPSIPMKKEVVSSRNQKGIMRYLIALCFMSKVLWNTVGDMMLYLATALFLKDTDTPVKGSIGTQKNPRRIVHRILSLDDIKLIKKDLNMTINDVILGITQAGLSKYLNRRYGNISSLREVRDTKDNLPKDIRLRATVLVNVRPSSGIQELANLMEKGSKCPWGNSIAYVILPFHIALRDDPLDYIRQAKAVIDTKKQSLEAKCTYASGKLMLHLLGEKVVAALSHRLVSQTTMSFSNVVGPVEEISFYGHPIAYIAPTALTIHYQSHVGKMTLVVAVDEAVIPDPHLLSDDIAQSLSVIKAALIN
ncbi:hypothetical protein V2J09_009010 [Rumex salicifolius]